MRGSIVGLGRVHHLGQVKPWTDQVSERLSGSAIGLGMGLGIGFLLAFALPSARWERKDALILSAVASGVSVASALIPVEGKFFDKLSFFAAGASGAKLAYAAVGK